MPERSAGILLHRPSRAGTEVLLVHPGGPFWSRKDDGAWTIPKGLEGPGEDPEAAARREFGEETGMAIRGPLQPLGVFRQPSGKIITVFTSPGDFDPATLASNMFSLEWPPRSGRTASFPEIDRAGWFGEEDAMRKMVAGQRPILATFFKISGRGQHEYRVDKST